MPKPRQGSDSQATLASRVYERIRADIVRGVLQPAEKLKVEALSLRYDMGTSPIREALNRLCSVGLVIQRDQRGFVVAPVGLDDLVELTNTRCWINEIGIRESLRNGDTTWEENVLLALHRLSKTPLQPTDPMQRINEEWDRRHLEFHDSLLSACGSRWLINISRMLFDCADRYRHLVFPSAAAGKRDVLGEHREIMEAALARDVARTTELLNEHIWKTSEMLVSLGAVELPTGVLPSTLRSYRPAVTGHTLGRILAIEASNSRRAPS